MKRYPIFFSFYFLVLSLLFAQDDLIDFGGSFQYAKKVDLSHQLFFPRKTQHVFGGSCHIFAVTALYESFCYRRLGKKLDLSEAYLFYRHQREELAKRSKERFKRFPEIGQFDLTEFDAGFVKDSIRRIFAHSITVEPYFRMWGDSVYELHDIVNGHSSFSSLDLLERYISDFCPDDFMNESCLLQSLQKIKSDFFPSNLDIAKKLDKWFLNYVETSTFSSPDKGRFATPEKDSELAKCGAAGVSWTQTTEFTHHKAVHLLSSNIPFICKATVNNGAWHVLLALGYRYNDKMASNIEYKLWDPNRKVAEWGWQMECSEITFINRVGMNPLMVFE